MTAIKRVSRCYYFKLQKALRGRSTLGHFWDSQIQCFVKCRRIVNSAVKRTCDLDSSLEFRGIRQIYSKMRNFTLSISIVNGRNGTIDTTGSIWQLVTNYFRLYDFSPRTGNGRTYRRTDKRILFLSNDYFFFEFSMFRPSGGKSRRALFSTSKELR